MARDTFANQFSLELWDLLSAGAGLWEPDRPLMAFASSVAPYFALVVKDKEAIKRIVYRKTGIQEKVVDTYTGPDEGCTLPQKLVGHSLPLIASGLSCPNLIDLEGYYGVALTHLFFDQMLPLFSDCNEVDKWFKQDWFIGSGTNVNKDLLEEFEYQKDTLETIGVELIRHKDKKARSAFAGSLDALKATQAYLKLRRRPTKYKHLVYRAQAHMDLAVSCALVDHLSQSDVQIAQISNLKRAFNAQSGSYASALAVTKRGSSPLQRSPVAVHVTPHFEFNTLAFALSKTAYDSFVGWEIKRSSNLMLLD